MERAPPSPFVSRVLCFDRPSARVRAPTPDMTASVHTPNVDASRGVNTSAYDAGLPLSAILAGECQDPSQPQQEGLMKAQTTAQGCQKDSPRDHGVSSDAVALAQRDGGAGVLSHEHETTRHAPIAAAGTLAHGASVSLGAVRPTALHVIHVDTRDIGRLLEATDMYEWQDGTLFRRARCPSSGPGFVRGTAAAAACVVPQLLGQEPGAPGLPG